MTPLDARTRSEIIARVLAARENRDGFLEGMRSRQRRGHEVAKECARILKERFGASRVVLFGSMLRPEEMSPRSDIDLAVWGLKPEELFRAGAAIERGHEFTVDLVEAPKAKPCILKAIDEGIEL